MFEFDDKLYATETEANAEAEKQGYVILEWFWEDGRYLADFEPRVDA